MRKFELEELVAEHEGAMERAYDAILDGDPEAAREMLAEALDLEEPDESGEGEEEADEE